MIDQDTSSAYTTTCKQWHVTAELWGILDPAKLADLPQAIDALMRHYRLRVLKVEAKRPPAVLDMSDEGDEEGDRGPPLQA